MWRGASGSRTCRRELVDAAPRRLAGLRQALTALLEVLPPSAAFRPTARHAGAVAEAASDSEALEHLRRLMFSDRVPEPEQLRIDLGDAAP